jgi:hypothetical protein
VDEDQLTIILHGLAIAYSDLGDKYQALTFLNLSLPMFRIIGRNELLLKGQFGMVQK